METLHNEVGPGGPPCAPPYVRRVRICGTLAFLFHSAPDLSLFCDANLLAIFFSCCQQYYIVLPLAPIGLLAVRLSSWLACVWGCRIVKGLCQYTSSVFRSLILACISISILGELRHGAHCSPALD
jgi:hypothetical protein